MSYIKIILYSLVFLCILPLNAQEVLTKKRAIEIALENNYGVKVANNNVEIAKNNSSIFNTRHLPTLTTRAGVSYNNSNQEIEFQNGDVTNVKGAETENFNASLNLNYTIFDGLGRKYNYEQLKENYNLSELEARATIENMYLQLFTVYFQIARLSENTKNLIEALAVSKDRLKRAQYQYEYGQTNKLELLNAEVDVNNDSINLLNTNQLFANTKRDLGIVLGVQDNSIIYNVETDVNFIALINIEELLVKAKANNVSLIQNEKNIAINELNLKINKSSYLPTIGLTSSYGWNKNINPVTAFSAFSENTGFNAGLNLTWNVFDGGLTKTRVANSIIAIENQKILREQQIITLESQLRNSYDSYQNALFILEAQEQNVRTNQNNFERTQERYILGQVTSIEFRLAQINLLNAKTAYDNAKYDAKLFELNLLQLSGELLNIDFL